MINKTICSFFVVSFCFVNYSFADMWGGIGRELRRSVERPPVRENRRTNQYQECFTVTNNSNKMLYISWGNIIGNECESLGSGLAGCLDTRYAFASGWFSFKPGDSNKKLICGLLGARNDKIYLRITEEGRSSPLIPNRTYGAEDFCVRNDRGFETKMYFRNPQCEGDRVTFYRLDTNQHFIHR